jgi:hypothetical protein
MYGLTIQDRIIDIQSDGEVLYFRRFAGTSGAHQICAVAKANGLPIWITDMPAGLLTTLTAVDDRYLWGMVSGTGVALDKTTGRLVWLGTAEIHCTDAWQAYGTDGSDSLLAVCAMRQTKTFMRVFPDDPKRAPFFNLAIPLNDARSGPLPDSNIYFEIAQETPGDTAAVFPDPTPFLSLPFFCPAGRYRLEYYLEWAQNSTAQDAIAEVRIDGGAHVARLEQSPQTGLLTQRHPTAGFVYVNIGEGSHVVTLEWGVTASTMRIHRAKLSLERVGD